MAREPFIPYGPEQYGDIRDRDIVSGYPEFDQEAYLSRLYRDGYDPLAAYSYESMYGAQPSPRDALQRQVDASQAARETSQRYATLPKRVADAFNVYKSEEVAREALDFADQLAEQYPWLYDEIEALLAKGTRPMDMQYQIMNKASRTNDRASLSEAYPDFVKDIDKLYKEGFTTEQVTSRMEAMKGAKERIESRKLEDQVAKETKAETARTEKMLGVAGMDTKGATNRVTELTRQIVTARNRGEDTSTLEQERRLIQSYGESGPERARRISELRRQEAASTDPQEKAAIRNMINALQRGLEVDTEMVAEAQPTPLEAYTQGVYGSLRGAATGATGGALRPVFAEAERVAAGGTERLGAVGDLRRAEREATTPEERNRIRRQIESLQGTQVPRQGLTEDITETAGMIGSQLVGGVAGIKAATRLLPEAAPFVAQTVGRSAASGGFATIQGIADVAQGRATKQEAAANIAQAILSSMAGAGAATLVPGQVRNAAAQIAADFATDLASDALLRNKLDDMSFQQWMVQELPNLAVSLAGAGLDLSQARAAKQEIRRQYDLAAIRGEVPPRAGAAEERATPANEASARVAEELATLGGREEPVRPVEQPAVDARQRAEAERIMAESERARAEEELRQREAEIAAREAEQRAAEEARIAEEARTEAQPMPDEPSLSSASTDDLLRMYNNSELTAAEIYDVLKSKKTLTDAEANAVAEYERGYRENFEWGFRMEDLSDEYLVKALRKAPKNKKQAASKKTPPELSPTSKYKNFAGYHADSIRDAFRNKKPVLASAADEYEFDIPSGYSREGDLYVYREPPATPIEPERAPVRADDGRLAEEQRLEEERRLAEEQRIAEAAPAPEAEPPTPSTVRPEDVENLLDIDIGAFKAQIEVEGYTKARDRVVALAQRFGVPTTGSTKVIMRKIEEAYNAAKERQVAEGRVEEYIGDGQRVPQEGEDRIVSPEVSQGRPETGGGNRPEAGRNVPPGQVGRDVQSENVIPPTAREITSQSGAKYIEVKTKSGRIAKRFVQTKYGRRVGDRYDSGYRDKVIVFEQDTGPTAPLGNTTDVEYVKEVLAEDEIIVARRRATDAELAKERAKLEEEQRDYGPDDIFPKEASDLGYVKKGGVYVYGGDKSLEKAKQPPSPPAPMVPPVPPGQAGRNVQGQVVPPQVAPPVSTGRAPVAPPTTGRPPAPTAAATPPTSVRPLPPPAAAAVPLSSAGPLPRGRTAVPIVGRVSQNQGISPSGLLDPDVKAANDALVQRDRDLNRIMMTKSKGAFDSVAEDLWDSQAFAKRKLISADLRDVESKLILRRGWSGEAKAQYNDRINSIKKIVTPGNEQAFSNYIEMRRLVEASELQESRGIDYDLPYGITVDQARKWISAFEAEKTADGTLDSFKAAADEYYAAAKQQLDEMLNEGLLSPSAHASLVANHKYYSPQQMISRLDPENESGLAAPTGGDPVRRLTSGSESGRVSDYRYLLARTIASAQSRIYNNRANKALVDAAQSGRAAGMGIIDNTAGYDQVPTGFKRITAYDAGNKKDIFVPTEFAKSWEDSDPVFRKQTAEMLRTWSGARLVKALATGYNPEFIISNFPRDAAYAWLRTKEYNPVLPIGMMQQTKDYIETARDAFSGTGLYRQYVKEGGALDGFSGEGRIEANPWENVRPANQTVKDIGRFMGKLGEVSERWARLAVFKRAMKNGNTPTEAARIARDMLDFSQGGRYTKAADTFIPYLNAATQGTRGLMAGFSENGLGRQSFKIGQVMALAAGLGSVAREYFKDQWDSISDKEKASKWIIPLPKSFSYIDESGKKRYRYLAIAKDQGQAVFAAMADSMVEMERGGKLDKKQMLSAFESAFPDASAGSPLYNAYRAYVDNYDTFRKEQVYRGRATTPSGELSGVESFDKLAQKLSDISEGSVEISPLRFKTATEKVVLPHNPIVAMTGLLANQMLPEELQTEFADKMITASPFIRRFIRSTAPVEVPGATSEKAERLDVDISGLPAKKAAQKVYEEEAKVGKSRNIQDREIRRIMSGIKRGEMSENDLLDFIGEYPGEYQRLRERAISIQDEFGLDLYIPKPYRRKEGSLMGGGLGGRL